MSPSPQFVQLLSKSSGLLWKRLSQRLSEGTSWQRVVPSSESLEIPDEEFSWSEAPLTSLLRAVELGETLLNHSGSSPDVAFPFSRPYPAGRNITWRTDWWTSTS